jgi:hypothetical protein
MSPDPIFSRDFLTRHLARRENWKKAEPASEPSRKIGKKPSQLPSRAGKLEKSRASFRAEPANWKKAEPASEPSQAKTARAGPSHKPSRAKYLLYVIFEGANNALKIIVD